MGQKRLGWKPGSLALLSPQDFPGLISQQTLSKEQPIPLQGCLTSFGLNRDLGLADRFDSASDIQLV